MTTELFDYQADRGVYEQRLPEPARRRLGYFTAFCSAPSAPRGEYDEEIDVLALGPAPAKRIAQAVLDADYEPGMKVRRLVSRQGWFL